MRGGIILSAIVAAFAFAAALALIVSVLLACAPTLLLRRADLTGFIKARGAQSSRGSRSHLRGALVLIQVLFGMNYLFDNVQGSFK